MKKHNLSEEQTRIMDVVVAKKAKYLSMLESGDWVNQSVDKKTGLRIDMMEMPSKINAVRGVGVIDAPLDQVFLTLHDSSYKKYFDANIDEASIVKKVAPNTYINYQRSKSLFLISAREFVLLHHLCKFEDGRVLTLLFTPDWDTSHYK